MGGGYLLNISRSRISLNAEAVQSDAAILETALAEQQFDAATDQLLAIGAKPLLDQMHFGDEFGEWLDSRRRQVEQALQNSVSRALSRLKDSGNLATHAGLSNAWRVRGPDVTAISERKHGKTRIAVLPFRSMASPDDQGFFADGIVDELITTLGQVPQLLVASRTSTFHFKGSNKQLPEIAAALNVSHLVEGLVQRQDEQVRIHVSLTEGETGFELWSYSYDDSFDHIFVTRKEVTQAVNDGIAEALALTGPSPHIRGLTDNREAYGLYLQGRALTIRAIGNGVMEKAVHLLERALELDPEFAECWTALAEAKINLTVYTPCLDRLKRCEKAAGYAEKALQLSPQQAHVRVMLAVYRWTRNDIIGALDLVFEAYRLDPNNPDVVNRVGSFLAYCGLNREALPYIEASIDQDPVQRGV